MTVGGDASRLRPDPGTRIGSTLRNLTLTLIHRQGATTRAEARRFFATPVHALALVVSPPSTICRPCANSPKKGLDERGQKA